MTFRFASLFAGIGGFDSGLEQAGMECDIQVEIDRHCRRVLKRHWPGVRRIKDVRKAKIEKGSVRLLCGGFPCQDLSVAGKRAGLAGERSGLFWQFARIAAEVRPRWLLVENVPGLLSSNEGRDMATVLGALGELGYGWAYRSLDSQYFGLAQRRERVFIVGCLGEPARASEVLFEHESCERNPPSGEEKGADVAATIRGRSHGPGSNAVNLVMGTLTPGAHPGGFNGQDIDNLSILYQCITSGEDARQDGENCTSLVYNIIGGGQNSRKYAYRSNRTGAIQSKGNSASGNEAGTVIVTTLNSGGNRGGFRTEPGEHLVVAPNTANSCRSSRVGIRRLTPTECLRLQGFPDGWLDLDPPLSDSAKYKMTGNAVSVPVAKWIGRRMKIVDAK